MAADLTLPKVSRQATLSAACIPDSCEHTQAFRMPDKSLSPEEIQRNRKLAAPLRAWLKQSKHNQKYIAEQLNVSEPTVSKWLSGKQTMSVPTFMAIAALLGAQPEEALGGPEYRQRAARYQKLSEIVARLNDDQLRALEGIAAQLAPPTSGAK